MLRITSVIFLTFVSVVACSSSSGSNDIAQDQDLVADVPSDVAVDVTGQDVPADLTADVTPDLGDDLGQSDALDAQPGDLATDSAAADSDGADVLEKPFGTACDPAQRVGKFQVGLKKFASEFSGRVFDGVDYNGVPTPKQVEGACRIVQRKPWFCDPPCDSGFQCTDKGECVGMPAPVDVGKVTVTGLTAEVSVSADGGLNYTFLDFDGAAFEPGTPIKLTATGNEAYDLSLEGEGVEKLELESPNWTLKMDTPFEAKWTAGSGQAEILITLNVDQHGSTPATLLCLVEDTGAYTIPASMVSALLAYGVNGAPTAYVFRRTVDSAKVPGGCIEFEVYSQVNLFVTVE